MTDLGLAVQLFFREGQVKELRIMTTEGVQSGFYDNRMLLGLMAKGMGQELGPDDGVKAVYWTLNPINRSTLKYVDNELNPRPRFATRGTNILQREWLLIDVDAERESGTNATDAEKLEGWKVLSNVVAFLRSIGWAEPVIVDSGNGYHALYKINVAAADNDTVRNVLKVLAWRYDTAGAKVDQGVFDAPRICKVPGTWVRKGPHSAERPHRMSRFISIPEKIGTVSIVQLVDIRRYAPPVPPPAPTPAAHISKKRLKEMFETYKDEITVFAVRKKGAATHYSLEECPFNEGAHRDQKSSHKTDIIIRPTGATFKCQSDDCADYNFGDFLDLMEERTGIRFDPEDDEELAERWGGIESVAE
jgi:hypothetical protein